MWRKRWMGFLSSSSGGKLSSWSGEGREYKYICWMVCNL